jgi:multisubunit Na+/H+ antiporter MnhG subunit
MIFKKYFDALMLFMNVVGAPMGYSQLRSPKNNPRTVMIKGSYFKSVGYSFLLVILWMMLIFGLFVIKKSLIQNVSLADASIIIVWSLLIAPVIAVLIARTLFPGFTSLLRAQIQADSDENANPNK